MSAPGGVTHPADGLYTFSAARARELGACSRALKAWVSRHGEAVVPVTLADMTAQQEADSLSVGWCLNRMRRYGRIEAAEQDDALCAYSATGVHSEEARALMDCLLVRAKREGRAS